MENAYAYDAFGNLRGQAGELLNRILYTGQQYDQEMGQYYLRARYYNPQLGRFTQEDVHRGDGLNLYVYCHNNPVIYYDPSGYANEIYGYDSATGTYTNRETGSIVPSSVAKPTTVGTTGQSSVYRVIRPDEDPSAGIFAKNSGRDMSVTGHVQSGSRNKGSQYISTTTDLDVANHWANESGNSIVEIDLKSLPEGTRVYDLSTEEGRDMYLSNDRSKGFASASSEVLITDEVPTEGVTVLKDKDEKTAEGEKCP